MTFHMVADRMGYTLLVLAITLNLCHAQSQCNTMETCQLKDTRGTSTASSLIPRSSVYPPRCPVLCSRRAECLATTYDPTTENCELHEVYADGAPCMTLSTNLGSSFSMVKEPGIPCPKGPYFKNDYTCNAPFLGGRKNGGTEWSDESCALIHGPVTGVRLWKANNMVKLLQVRYGEHWAPVHPDQPIQGALREILLAPGEYFTKMDARSGWIIDAVAFTSNLQTYPRAGGGGTLYRSVPLNGVLYFSGASMNYYGHRVSKLVAHRETCEAP